MDLITVIIAITIIVLVPSKRVVQKIKVTLDNVVFYDVYYRTSKVLFSSSQVIECGQ